MAIFLEKQFQIKFFCKYFQIEADQIGLYNQEMINNILILEK